MKDNKSDAKAQTVVFLTSGGILTLLLGTINHSLQFSFPNSLLFNFLILAIIGSMAYFLKYSGFQVLDTSEVVIFATTSKLWNVFGGFLFLKEPISINKILGSIVIMIGIAFAIYTNGKFKINKGTLLVLISAFLFGVTDINGFFILQNISATSYQIYFYFLPVIATLAIQPKTLSKISYYFSFKRGIKVFLLSIFDVLGMLALFYSYQVGGRASVIGPLSATKVILTTILAMLFLKERKHLMNKLFGAMVTVLGIILLL